MAEQTAHLIWLICAGQAHHLGHDLEDDHLHRRQARPARLQGAARRWVMERTFAWISNHRRATRDYIASPQLTGMIKKIAAINPDERSGSKS